MNNQKIEGAVRPGFIILLACVVAVVVILIWRHQAASSAIHAPTADAEAPAAVTPADVASPAPVAESEMPAQPASETQPAAAATTIPASAPAANATSVASTPSSALEAQWGIQFSEAWLTMGNTEVELLYRVSDPGKAALLGNTGTNTYIVDLATGVKMPMVTPPPERAKNPRSRALSMALMTPEAGAFPPPSGRLIVGRTYVLLIPNRGLLLKSGSPVAVEVANYRSQNLSVQ